MGKARKRLQARRARHGAAAMEIDEAAEQGRDLFGRKPVDFGSATDMDASEVNLKLQSRSIKKAIRKRHSVNVRKKKALIKAVAVGEKTQHKAQQDACRAAAKNSMKQLY